MTIHWFGDCHPCLASEECEVFSRAELGSGKSALEARAPPAGRGLPHTPEHLSFPVPNSAPDEAGLQGGWATGPSLLPLGPHAGVLELWENGLLRAPAEVCAPSGLRLCPPVGGLSIKPNCLPLCGKQSGGRHPEVSSNLFCCQLFKYRT